MIKLTVIIICILQLCGFIDMSLLEAVLMGLSVGFGIKAAVHFLTLIAILKKH